MKDISFRRGARSQSENSLTGNTHQSALAPVSLRAVSLNASATANCCTTAGRESQSPEHCCKINNNANSGV